MLTTSLGISQRWYQWLITARFSLRRGAYCLSGMNAFRSPPLVFAQHKELTRDEPDQHRAHRGKRHHFFSRQHDRRRRLQPERPRRLHDRQQQHQPGLRPQRLIGRRRSLQATVWVGNLGFLTLSPHRETSSVSGALDCFPS